LPIVDDAFGDGYLAHTDLGTQMPSVGGSSHGPRPLHDRRSRRSPIASDPAVILSLTVLAFNFIGDGLRDAIDPWMKR